MKKDIGDKKRIYWLIDGTRLCGPRKQVGYCWYDLHPGFLTKFLMNKHECVEKKCPYFERFKGSPYWVNRERIKNNRVKGKAKKTLRLKNQDIILKKFRKFTTHIDGFAVSGVEYKDGIYYVRCVSLAFINVKKLQEYAKQLSFELNVCIRLFFIKNTYAKKSELIRKVVNEMNM